MNITAEATHAKRGQLVILEDGETFRVTSVRTERATGELTIFGREEDGTEFGPYYKGEYRVIQEG